MHILDFTKQPAHEGDDFKHFFAEVYVTFNTMLRLALVFMVICYVLMAEARRLHAPHHQDTKPYPREFFKVSLLIEGD